MEKRTIVYAVQLSILVFFVSPLSAQVLEASKLPILLNQSQKDSIKKLERLAALKFHERINKYRLENGINKLAWDDTLWLASRNHCLWMDANDSLSHDEIKNTKNFTGDDPGDRYEYACNKKGGCSWSGENALYNFPVGGTTIEEQANGIAEECFEAWKSSYGHNQNMLGPASRVHGVAFYISSKGKVWGTDLFSYKPVYMKEENTFVSTTNSSSNIIKQEQSSIVSKKKIMKVNIPKTTATLLDSLYAMSSTKRNAAKEKAAQHHALYMEGNRKVSHIENKNGKRFYGKNEQTRMIKASRGFFVLSKRRTKLIESIAFVEVDVSELKIDTLSATILEELNKEKRKVTRANNVGFGISIKQTKNKLKIYVVRLEDSQLETTTEMAIR